MANIYRFVNAGAAAASADTPFAQSFNATTSWGSPSGGQYSIIIPETTHDKGINPTVTVYERIATDFFQVGVDAIEIDSAGNVTISVSENIDTRFEGKIIIK